MIMLNDRTARPTWSPLPTGYGWRVPTATGGGLRYFFSYSKLAGRRVLMPAVSILGAGPFGLAATAHLKDDTAWTCGSLANLCPFGREICPLACCCALPVAAGRRGDPGGELGSRRLLRAATGRARGFAGAAGNVLSGYGRWLRTQAVPAWRSSPGSSGCGGRGHGRLHAHPGRR